MLFCRDCNKNVIFCGAKVCYNKLTQDVVMIYRIFGKMFRIFCEQAK